MPANWGTFISSVTSYLQAGNSPTELATAQFIASSYAIAVATSTTLISSAPMTTPINVASITSGFDASFQLNKAVGTGVVPPSNWMPAAGAIVSAWGTMIPAPMPPMPPCVAPLAGHIITFPGDPTSLSVALQGAFSAQTAPAVASALALAFQTHLATIAGNYFGLWPNPSAAATGVPLTPFPWVAPAIGPPAPIPWVGII